MRAGGTRPIPIPEPPESLSLSKTDPAWPDKLCAYVDAHLFWLHAYARDQSRALIVLLEHVRRSDPDAAATLADVLAAWPESAEGMLRQMVSTLRGDKDAPRPDLRIVRHNASPGTAQRGEQPEPPEEA